MQLRALAEQHTLQLIEDDYDYEYHFEGTPLLPLAAGDDGSGRCIYVASLSKLIAPAFRLGYVVAAQPVIVRLRRVRAVIDRQGDAVLERAVAELIEEGELQRHARRARQLYRERRDHTLGLLGSRAVLRDHITCTPPSGGLALWLRVQGVELAALAKRAHARGLGLDAIRSQPSSGHHTGLRFGFARHTPDELTKIVGILEASLESFRQTRRRTSAPQ